MSKDKDAKFAATETAALKRIEDLEDPDKLGTLIKNAERLGSKTVVDAAFRKRMAVLSAGEAGSVEHDFWQSIHTLEDALTRERGKTTRLSRTRPKLARVGAVKTLSDLAISPKPSEGFAMLIERGLLDLTAEAVILRHSSLFDTEVCDAARARLHEAGYEPDKESE